MVPESGRACRHSEVDRLLNARVTIIPHSPPEFRRDNRRGGSFVAVDESNVGHQPFLFVSKPLTHTRRPARLGTPEVHAQTVEIGFDGLAHIGEISDFHLEPGLFDNLSGCTGHDCFGAFKPSARRLPVIALAGIIKTNQEQGFVLYNEACASHPVSNSIYDFHPYDYSRPGAASIASRRRLACFAFGIAKGEF